MGLTGLVAPWAAFSLFLNLPGTGPFSSNPCRGFGSGCGHQDVSVHATRGVRQGWGAAAVLYFSGSSADLNAH